MIMDLQQRPEDPRRYWERALKQLKSARDRVANSYDAGRKHINFKVGYLVLCRTHKLSSKVKKYSAKLSNKWLSPLLMARFLTGVTPVSEPRNWGDCEEGPCDTFEEVFSGRIAVVIGWLQGLSGITTGFVLAFDLTVYECVHVSCLLMPTTRLRTNLFLVCV
jgi:hypothetical protein